MVLGMPLLRTTLPSLCLVGSSSLAYFASWLFSLILKAITSSTVLLSTDPFRVILLAYFVWGRAPGYGHDRAGNGSGWGGTILRNWTLSAGNCHACS